MRPRIVVLASLLTALTVAAAPSVASAAPHHNRGLTINATPNPILAGDGVLIYGQLSTPPVGSQTIVLYHHISGSHAGYTRIGSTTTDATGFYEFTRAEGVVLTNRSWFAREDGVHGVHSRTAAGSASEPPRGPAQAGARRPPIPIIRSCSPVTPPPTIRSGECCCRSR